MFITNTLLLYILFRKTLEDNKIKYYNNEIHKNRIKNAMLKLKCYRIKSNIFYKNDYVENIVYMVAYNMYYLCGIG